MNSEKCQYKDDISIPLNMPIVLGKVSCITFIIMSVIYSISDYFQLKHTQNIKKFYRSFYILFFLAISEAWQFIEQEMLIILILEWSFTWNMVWNLHAVFYKPLVINFYILIVCYAVEIIFHFIWWRCCDKLKKNGGNGDNLFNLIIIS